jgi:hypothetical protein
MKRIMKKRKLRITGSPVVGAVYQDSPDTETPCAGDSLPGVLGA